MKRREIVKYTALATGAALSAPLISSILSGCNTEVASQTDGFKPVFFKSEDFERVTDLVDVILPRTDSPSATEVGVHRMIDHMVGKAYKVDAQSNYRKGYNALASYLKSNRYDDKDGNEKQGILSGLLRSNSAADAEAKEGLNNLRNQTIAYYLTTEEVGTKFLNYLPVPGTWEPCVSVADLGGKAWAI